MLIGNQRRNLVEIRYGTGSRFLSTKLQKFEHTDWLHVCCSISVYHSIKHQINLFLICLIWLPVTERIQWRHTNEQLSGQVSSFIIFRSYATQSLLHSWLLHSLLSCHRLFPMCAVLNPEASLISAFLAGTIFIWNCGLSSLMFLYPGFGNVWRVYLTNSTDLGMERLWISECPVTVRVFSLTLSPSHQLCTISVMTIAELARIHQIRLSVKRQK